MKKSIFVAILVVSCLQSCLVKAVMKSVGIYDKKNTIKKVGNGAKELCFLPMHHIGKQEFYDDTKFKLDSLSKNGYYIFFEGIQGKNMDDKNLKDTLFRKLRKLTGIDFVKMGKSGGYIDTLTNESIFENELINRRIQKDNLVNQPSSLRKTSDSTTGKGVDVLLVELVSTYEKKYGVVQLNGNDFVTELGSKYERNKKDKINKDQRKYLLLEIRNEIIAKEITNSKYKKIVLVYGKAHYDGILKDLNELDSKFIEIK